MKSVCLYIVLTSCFYSQIVNVAFGIGKPPYILTNEKDGIEIRLMKKILTNMSYEMNMSFLAFHYLQKSPLKRKVDIAVGVAPKDDGLFYSDGFTEYKNVAIIKKSKNKVLNSYTDFNKLRIGAWKNASKNLGKKFSESVNDDTYRYYEYPDQKDQFIAFTKGSIDIMIVDMEIFNWYKKKYDILTKDVSVYHLFKSKFTHVSFKNKQLRGMFNIHLKKLKASGEFDRVVKTFEENSKIH